MTASERIREARTQSENETRKSIDYTVTLRISVPEGSGLAPYLDEFYAPLGVIVEVVRAPSWADVRPTRLAIRHRANGRRRQSAR